MRPSRVRPAARAVSGHAEGATLDLLLKGHALLSEGRLSDALQCAEQALGGAADDTDALHLLAAVHYRREGAMTGLFRSVSLEETVRRVREDYNAALESLTAITRAGAGIILTYWAKDVAKWLA